jgi:hypothetical protein
MAAQWKEVAREKIKKSENGTVGDGEPDVVCVCGDGGVEDEEHYFGFAVV